MRTNRPSSGRVRMLDVARKAGVSAQTVSRVIRQPKLVKETTRKKVQSVIEKLNYVPDSAASDLASNQSRIVAAIIPSVSMSIYEDTVGALSSGLLEAGYQLLLGNTEYSLESEEATIRAFLGRRPEAMVVVGVNHTERACDLMRNADIPVIQTMELTQTPIDTVIGYSNRDATFEMTGLVLAKGYRKVAFIGTSDDERGAARRQGYLDALALDDIPPVVVEEAFKSSLMSTGAKMLNKVLSRAADTDAIVFSNDLVAAGAIFECQRRGIDIPGDIAIAGFGDFEIAANINPGLTTVRMPGHEVGGMAAEVIVDRLGGGNKHPHIIDVGFEVIERAST